MSSDILAGMTKRHDNRFAAEDRAERAQRIAAMLARWEAEEVSDEPDWEVADIERCDLPVVWRA